MVIPYMYGLQDYKYVICLGNKSLNRRHSKLIIIIINAL